MFISLLGRVECARESFVFFGFGARQVTFSSVSIFLPFENG
uniref:Uncharacterized protein n=1 Tax=Nelumbo nucifera TaxID=4432 RepID=A0A822Z1I7_NELNU|nr:TPA_asm: hypothetical protein HUJ06_014597 [Nelumbo nucifera]